MCDPLTLDQVVTSMRLFALHGLEPCLKFFDANASHNSAVELLVQCNPDSNAIHSELHEGRLRALQNPVKFHPLPLGPGGNASFSLAFFRPALRALDGATPECDLNVVLLSGTPPHRLGLRFERGLDENDTHGYAHIQFTRNFISGPTTDVPAWMPESYPAFPTRCSAMGDTWLAVLVSLYGLNSGDQSGLGAVVAAIKQAQSDWTGDEALLTRARHVFYPN